MSPSLCILPTRKTGVNGLIVFFIIFFFVVESAFQPPIYSILSGLPGYEVILPLAKTADESVESRGAG